MSHYYRPGLVFRPMSPFWWRVMEGGVEEIGLDVIVVRDMSVRFGIIRKNTNCRISEYYAVSPSYIYWYNATKSSTSNALDPPACNHQAWPVP